MGQLVRRFTRATIGLFALLLVFAAGAAHAETTVPNLPFVNNFATARFKLLSTVAIGDLKLVGYGAGDAVMPDRSSLWLASQGSDQTVSIVQIGKTIYQRAGNGEWKRSDAGVTDMQFQPLSAQFNQLQQYATAIYDMGPQAVGSTPAEHYQVWLDGSQALAMLGTDTSQLSADQSDLIAQTHYKYDFWIGTQDSFMYQQNVEILMPAYSANDADVPAVQLDILMTFYNINNPNISVNAPI